MRRAPFPVAPRLLLALPLALVLPVGLSAQADQIRPARGNPFVAKAWDQDENEVRFNHYRTGIRKVTHGTETRPAKAIKSITPDPDPHRSFWRKAAELKDGTADAWVALGIEARADKLRGLATTAFLEALAREPSHEGAKKELGSDAKKLLAQDPRTNPELKANLAAFLAEEDAAARAKLAAAIAAAAPDYPVHYLERARRSLTQPKGRTDDRLLTYESKLHPGAVYTLLVPNSYDPLAPTPLVLGLHGGGAGGKDRTGVVGSGSSAMNFFAEAADRLGWIVVCPTALRAPWAHPDNDSFVLDLLAEIKALFNIDENRIYLAGHSMGGFGAWHFGSKYPHLWAAFSPNAGGGRPNLGLIADTKTGVYCYHGADDAVVGPSSDREIAEQMKDKNLDFVYCEIPDSGHGWPDEVRDEMWEFFKVRRLAATPKRTEKGTFTVTETPLSSFLAKPSKKEIEAFGPLGGADGPGDEAQEKQLLVDLEAGGGRAERASAELGARKDARLAARVAKVLSNSKLSPDARRFAALALGSMEQAEALTILRRSVADENLLVSAASALALGRLKDPEIQKSMRTAVASLCDRFDKKKSGKSMDFTDFEAHLEAGSEIASGIGAGAEAACVPSLESLSAHLLDPSVQVPVSERAGQNARIPRRRLALAIVDACAALAAPGAASLLESLAARDDLAVQDRAREVLGALPKEPVP